MTSANFSRPGAIDLSSLKAKAQAPTSAPGRSGGARGASYLVEVTEANFDQVMQGSMQHLIVIEFTSPRVSNGAALSATLEELATENAGKFLLARVDVDTSPQIVQALQIQSVPMVVGVLGGQLAPLFQGVQPREQVQAMLDQLFAAAVSNGIVGTAQPVGGPAEPATDEDDVEPERDPRFAAADDAMDLGDFEAARAEFDKLVTANPKDSEAVAGRATTGLLARTGTVDPVAARAAADAAPADSNAQLTAADVDMVDGTPDAAFARLVALIKITSGDERTVARLRLLELFETLEPTDPRVLTGRRNLMTALT